MSQSDSPDHCVKLSDPSQECRDTQGHIPDNMCFNCRVLNDKLVHLRNLKMEYIATGRKTIQDQSVDVARNALSQRILKAAQQYEELSDKREKVMNNSRRQPIDHDLMYAGISLASFKQNCEELIPIVAASTDQRGF